MIKLRKFSPKDLEQILAINLSSFSEPWPEKEFEKYAEESFVADDEGKIAGFAVCKIMEDEGALKLIAVNPDYRGKGIGKNLMEYIFKYFEEKGLKEITAHSRLHNEAGCDFLKSFGFKIIKTVENYYFNGEDAYLMIKKLDG